LGVRLLAHRLGTLFKTLETRRGVLGAVVHVIGELLPKNTKVFFRFFNLALNQNAELLELGIAVAFGLVFHDSNE